MKDALIEIALNILTGLGIILLFFMIFVGLVGLDDKIFQIENEDNIAKIESIQKTLDSLKIENNHLYENLSKLNTTNDSLVKKIQEHDIKYKAIKNEVDGINVVIDSLDEDLNNIYD